MSKLATGSVPVPDTPRKRSLGRTIGMIACSRRRRRRRASHSSRSGFVVWTIQRSFPQVSGEIALAGLDDAVTVQRDALGIPVITAETSARPLLRAGVRARAGPLLGDGLPPSCDERSRCRSSSASRRSRPIKFLRTLGWREVAEQEVAALDDTVRGYYEAYADGVNAYLADHEGAAVSLEYAVLGLQNADYEIEPWTPVDSVAWLKAMAWDLRGNIETETERALMAPDFTSEQIAQLYPGIRSTAIPSSFRRSPRSRPPSRLSSGRAGRMPHPRP